MVIQSMCICYVYEIASSSLMASTVVLAMSDAKKVAEGIAQYVDAIKLLEAIS